MYSVHRHTHKYTGRQTTLTFTHMAWDGREKGKKDIPGYANVIFNYYFLFIIYSKSLTR